MEAGKLNPEIHHRVESLVSEPKKVKTLHSNKTEQKVRLTLRSEEFFSTLQFQIHKLDDQDLGSIPPFPPSKLSLG